MGAFSSTLERTSQVEQDAARDVAEHTGQSLLLALLACMASLICLDILIGRSITRSLDGIRQFLAGLGNRLDQRLNSQGKDEVADIAHAIDHMLDNQADTIRLIQHARGLSAGIGHVGRYRGGCGRACRRGRGVGGACLDGWER